MISFVLGISITLNVILSILLFIIIKVLKKIDYIKDLKNISVEEREELKRMAQWY